MFHIICLLSNILPVILRSHINVKVDELSVIIKYTKFYGTLSSDFIYNTYMHISILDVMQYEN